MTLDNQNPGSARWPERPRTSRFHPWQWLVAFLVGCFVTFAGVTVVNGRLPFPVPSPTPTPTVTPLPLPDDAWAKSTATALPVSVTPPGSTLSLGAAGQVEIALGENLLALASVSAEAPTLAPEADQKVLLEAVPQLTGMSVYYYRVRVTKVSGAPMAGAELAPLFDALTSDGKAVQRFTIVDWKKCESVPAPANIDQDGTEVSLCFAAAVPTDGLTPSGVRFSQSGGPYDASKGTAVSWMPQ